MADFLIAVFVLVICCVTGKTIEKNHYKSIRKREIQLIKKPYLTYGNKILNKKAIKNIQLVSSNVVLGADKFNTVIASFKNIFGGNVSTFEALLDRGRREALLRIREKACDLGANILINIKYEAKKEVH